MKIGDMAKDRVTQRECWIIEKVYDDAPYNTVVSRVRIEYFNPTRNEWITTTRKLVLARKRYRGWSVESTRSPSPGLCGSCT